MSLLTHTQTFDLIDKHQTELDARLNILGQSYTSRVGTSSNNGSITLYNDIISPGDWRWNGIINRVTFATIKFIKFINKSNIKLWHWSDINECTIRWWTIILFVIRCAQFITTATKSKSN